ncbi:bifunctional diaminohydroxyphosphoribosylaminopyrimidine deaminase/5-amino-6-(5-phosphoribosylamino)uracil reductase RibD [bacterium BMS3Abin03]|nr:bifunctional diaminohydroxyphosphoribosylaminopyrimidine deaminase/5-amino-6-(5-phosphoribosylamino)uracil reductase RibD [bacterium BMS3Abin03]
MQNKIHQKYIKECFKFAEKGNGFVSPNPLVGAVIVKNGKIIGQGYHTGYGNPHAEAEAINDAVEDIKGSTLYCNLEPCCHTKKQTPPCVPLIIQKGISVVVISNLDPNPAVNGEGVKQLREAGVSVVTSVLENHGKELNRFYFKYVTKKIPYVTIKAAQSLDGKISRDKNQQTWLTGKEAKIFVHQQRAIYDAVLVGANTINVDNPQLDVREVDGRNPKRIIVDGSLNINLDSRIFTAADIENAVIITSENVDQTRLKEIVDKGVTVFQLPTDDQNRIKLNEILKKLGEEKITSLFVEGGSNIFSQFIDQKLFDELIILQAPVKLGKGVDGIPDSILRKLNKISDEQIGKDRKFTYRFNT